MISREEVGRRKGDQSLPQGGEEPSISVTVCNIYLLRLGTYRPHQMSFALAHQSNKLNKEGDAKTSTPAKHSSTPHRHITSLNRGSPDYISHLQQTIGNPALQRFVRSNNNNAKGCNFAKIEILQPKLKVSQPGDAYEQEADRVAEQVMRSHGMGSSALALSSKDEQGSNRKCTACQIRQEKEDIINRKPLRTSASETTDVIASEIDGIRSGSSSSVDFSTRHFMESRFGYDFRNVRIHTDERAARSAYPINSLAYTVGNDIVFGEGQYKPDTSEGKRLLAHELTHVVQGNLNNKVSQQPHNLLYETRSRDKIHGLDFQLVKPTISRYDFHRIIARSVSPNYSTIEDNLTYRFTDWAITDEEAHEVLTILAGLSESDLADTVGKMEKDGLVSRLIENISDADKIAFASLIESIHKKRSTSSVAAHIEDLMSYGVLDWVITDAEARLALETLKNLRSDPARLRAVTIAIPSDQYQRFFDNLSTEDRRDNLRFLQIIEMIRTTGVTVEDIRDLVSVTHEVTPEEHARVEHALSPGSTLVPPPAGAPAGTPPTVAQRPLMTGRGAGGPFETAMIGCLKAFVASQGTRFRSLRAAGPAAFPIASANDIAKAAQEVSESHFSPYIRVASRVPSSPYHPGSYSAAAMIRDQSTRPISDAGTSGHPGRIGWTDYWMSNSDICGPVLNSFNCDRHRSPDNIEFANVRDKFATDPANRADIDDTIHGWPAEATGGIYIQPYQTVASASDARKNRWDLFTTLIHEMMHVLTHPNYNRTFDLMGGQRGEILKEGMADVMRHDVWDPPGGGLKASLSYSAMNRLRARIEGGEFPHDASVVQYHQDYAQVSEARDIVAVVGMPNAKSAFFLGHTELLGLGTGTARSRPLTGVAMWTPTSSRDADIFVAQAGDTVASIQLMTNAPANGILNETSGTPIPIGTSLVRGTRLRIPGIRYVVAIAEDTLASIANQTAISITDLARANRLPTHTPGSHHFPTGTRVLIPIHTPQP